jgi:hypothetical protein
VNCRFFCLIHFLDLDSTANNCQSLLNAIESTENEFHDTSNATTNSSTTGDEFNLLIDETNGHNGKGNTRDRNGSSSLNHDQAITTVINQTTIPSTVSKSSNSHPPSTFSDNRKSKKLIFG